jgi:coniferyl-aldehyde dehydrogenase
MDSNLAEQLQLTLNMQRNAFMADPLPGVEVRRDRLQRLRAMLDKYADEIATAISQDFGSRSPRESLLADVFTSASSARHAARHVRRWMKPRRVPTALHFAPGRNRLMPQPLGVVGVIAPWNYPIFMALGPAVGALAAGNRVMIKPSELTPNTSALMAKMVAEFFAPEEMTVVTGDVNVARLFSALPFDHLVFTGSTQVGRQVAQAAAANLTPVTLELGGKSPVLVEPDADLAQVAERLAYGKLLNAGQTCIAPDYVLAPKAMVEPLAQAVLANMRRMFPAIAGNPDYTAVATQRHLDRLQDIVADAQAQGARVLKSHEDAQDGRKLTPHLLLDVSENMRVMREEIFGPLLPIIGVDSSDEAIRYIQRHERPLAMYWFGRNTAGRDKLLRLTHAGGVTVNDCIWHIGQEDQPFGGVGQSGQGAYHGIWGFNRMSHLKPVFYQTPFFAGTKLFQPPYGKLFDRLIGLLRKIA